MEAVKHQHNLKPKEKFDAFLTRIFEDSFEKFKDQKTNLIEQK